MTSPYLWPIVVVHSSREPLWAFPYFQAGLGIWTLGLGQAEPFFLEGHLENSGSEQLLFLSPISLPVYKTVLLTCETLLATEMGTQQIKQKVPVLCPGPGEIRCWVWCRKKSYPFCKEPQQWLPSLLHPRDFGSLEGDKQAWCIFLSPFYKEEFIKKIRSFNQYWLFCSRKPDLSPLRASFVVSIIAPKLCHYPYV